MIVMSTMMMIVVVALLLNLRGIELEVKDQLLADLLLPRCDHFNCFLVYNDDDGMVVVGRINL